MEFPSFTAKPFYVRFFKVLLTPAHEFYYCGGVPLYELIRKEEIEKIVAELASVINTDYSGQGVDSIIVVSVLKGSFLFCADLVRKLTVPRMKLLEFVGASSYEGTKSTGVVRFSEDFSRLNIRGAHVLVIEDIVDTGRTLARLKEELLKLKPASVRIVTFLDKPMKREVPMEADYVGRVVDGGAFVVGYGMDWNDLYRNLPSVMVIQDGDLKK